MMTAERDVTLDEKRSRCTCGSCPTYNECMRADELLLFCITGRAANCTFDKKGCLCPACPVAMQLGLKKSYYCIRGTEQEQR